jgi:hypothetical protein
VVIINSLHSVFNTVPASTTRWEFQTYWAITSEETNFRTKTSLLPHFSWGSRRTAGQRCLCFCRKRQKRDVNGVSTLRENLKKSTYINISSTIIHKLYLIMLLSLKQSLTKPTMSYDFHFDTQRFVTLNLHPHTSSEFNSATVTVPNKDISESVILSRAFLLH